MRLSKSRGVNLPLHHPCKLSSCFRVQHEPANGDARLIERDAAIRSDIANEVAASHQEQEQAHPLTGIDGLRVGEKRERNRISVSCGLMTGTRRRIKDCICICLCPVESVSSAGFRSFANEKVIVRIGYERRHKAGERHLRDRESFG